jgi:hypothetical protein
MLFLTPKERQLAAAYRAMLKGARQRSPKASSKPKRPLRGRELDPEHKAAISRLPCLATLRRFGVLRFGVHVAHVRFSNARRGAFNPGLQRKPDDRWTVPLSPNEHRLQHQLGEAVYWADLDLDPHQLALDLHDRSPDENAMLEVLLQHVQPLPRPTL